MDVGANIADIPLMPDDESEKAQYEFQRFLEETMNEKGEKEYGNSMDDLVVPDRNTLTVDLSRIQSHSGELFKLISLDYYRVYPYLCRALVNTALDRIDLSNAKEEDKKERRNKILRKQLYISFDKIGTHYKVRELTADKVGKLVCISGQVVRTHPVHPELWKGAFKCEECNTLVKGVEQHFKYTQPLKCANNACVNRSKFQLDIEHSMFVDFQKVRIQEVQAELPRGSIPRCVDVILRGECVEQAQPGDRCDITGSLIVIPDVAQIAIPGAKAESGARHRGQEGYEPDGLRGLKSLGVRDLNYRLAFLGSKINLDTPRFGGDDAEFASNANVEQYFEKLSNEERNKMIKMSQDRNIMSKLVYSLFPSIYGCEAVKKGVLLMLFGGVPKKTVEGTTLRGDINICIVGDPSTAKSQMLKQVEVFSPRAVYTSGKASSAAGLTAAVVKDEESFEFVIEAGALMLADNGVCCIDEFDKMDVKDQVAIHEAMEQQTISITKAGVKATLNARTSVLAAANPIGGRYDRSKSLRSNINLSPPIMSRFDLFFILVDESNDVVDYAIAKKIVDTHRDVVDDTVAEYDREEIRRYISFARLFKPQISDEAGEKLVELYKNLRLRESSGGVMNSCRITVRQLESLIRLSEAIARLRLKEFIEPQHVMEAHKLLSQSILRVEQPDITLEEEEEETPVAMEVSSEGAEETTEGKGDEPAIPAERLKLTFEQYKHISSLLVMHIRKLEEMEGKIGLRCRELREWYLNEIQTDLEDVEELGVQTVIVDRVIRRLITHDNILIELDDREDEEEGGGDGPRVGKADVTEPLLVVHPNFVLDED